MGVFKVLMFGLSNKPGGLEAAIYPMLPLFHDAGIMVDFVNAFQGKLFKEEDLIAEGSTIFQMNLRRRGRFFEYRRCVDAFFRLTVGGYDAIWMNVNEPDNGDLLYFAKKHGIKKRIVVAHSTKPFVRGGFLRKLSVVLSRHLIRKYATHRIGVSELAGKFAFKKAYSVIHNGIDINRFRFRADFRKKERDMYGISSEVKVYICVARLVSSKNHRFLLDVFSYIHKRDPKSLLLILGEGEQRESLVAYLDSLAMNDAVRIIGGVDDVSPLLCAADFFVFPSRFEGMGLALVEAECSGLPCFASDGVIPKDVEINTGTITWISLSLSSEKWAEAIISAEINTKRENAYLFANKFDFRVSAAAYINLLHS